MTPTKMNLFSVFHILDMNFELEVWILKLVCFFTREMTTLVF